MRWHTCTPTQPMSCGTALDEVVAGSTTHLMKLHGTTYMEPQLCNMQMHMKSQWSDDSKLHTCFLQQPMMAA